jgi:hypothetical protein
VAENHWGWVQCESIAWFRNKSDGHIESHLQLTWDVVSSGAGDTCIYLYLIAINRQRWTDGAPQMGVEKNAAKTPVNRKDHVSVRLTRSAETLQTFFGIWRFYRGPAKNASKSTALGWFVDRCILFAHRKRGLFRRLDCACWLRLRPLCHGSGWALNPKPKNTKP